MEGSRESPEHIDNSKKESNPRFHPSRSISLDAPSHGEEGRPSIVHHLSMPTYQSPLRHHRRTPSQHREVKETLNARSEYKNSQDDGKSHHYINQYLIGEEIGRGSFGAVHLATDQYGHEFAVKEFSKARLRKRAQSNILRGPHHFKPPGHLAAGLGLNAPLYRHYSSEVHKGEENENPLYLIKEEIAIMKKLNHPNLVQLIEVLDDPEEDSLYMVLEMCKKGVVMKVGLDEKADPYGEESCRYWFRDLILGIEYLHARGVVHRDIKPENLLLTEDDVLKIVDFGVSEMFEKESDMMTTRSVGSPAFLPPELCVAKHGEVSGKAADIWSMGISLYCLRFGRLPFERPVVLELYEAIKYDDINYPLETEPQLLDLMERILQKDPKKRITLKELREHPWVTKGGTDPLLSEEENTGGLLEPPTEIEMNHAITFNMRKFLVVMKAINKFKHLLYKKRPELISSVLGGDVLVVQPPLDLSSSERRSLHKLQSTDLSDRRPRGSLFADGVHRNVKSTHHTKASAPGGEGINSTVAAVPSTPDTPGLLGRLHTGQHTTDMPSPTPQAADTRRTRNDSGKDHTHDPTEEAPNWLGVGVRGPDKDMIPEIEVIAESPSAADFNIYDAAYENEVRRIQNAQGHKATIYRTQRVDSKMDENTSSEPGGSGAAGKLPGGLADAPDAAQGKEGSVTVAIQDWGEHAHRRPLVSLAGQGEGVRGME